MLTYLVQAVTNAEAWFNIALRPRKPEGSLGRTAQDGHLDSHTAPELCAPPATPTLPYIYIYRQLYQVYHQAARDPSAGTATDVPVVYKHNLGDAYALPLSITLAVRRWAGEQRGLGSNPLRLSFLFKSCVVCGHCLVTVSLTVYETSNGSHRYPP